MMKLINSVLILATMLLGGLFGSENTGSKADSYYFLEAQCRECAITSEGFKLNFYVITQKILKTDAPIDVDALESNFKKLLSEKFENSAPLLENIVVRTGTSEKKLARLQNNYREKYLKKGYHVKLLSD